MDEATSTNNPLIQRVLDAFDLDEINRELELTSIRLELTDKREIKIVDALIRKLNKLNEQEALEVKRDARIASNGIDLMVNSKGENAPTIDNFLQIMLNDAKYANIYYNVLKNVAEVHEPAGVRQWTDADEAESRWYIEQKYHIHSEPKHYDALRLLWSARSYNPIEELLNSGKWDGEERCEHFLTRWGKCPDTPYNRECSRLIFAGGVARALQAGCKFDNVIVFVGKQGGGKSSLVRFLATNDDYYGEVTTIDGEKAIEGLQGTWIAEIAELFAITKQKEQEAVKAFITRQRDKYRKPYDKNAIEIPRRVLMIGTSNDLSFLVDKTGNRRFFPVRMGEGFNGYDLYDHEQECRDYILQCWYEAKYKYDKGEMPSYPRRDLEEQYKEKQDEAMQDDWRVGAIGAFLDEQPRGKLVCAREIMREALSADSEHPKDPTLQESKIIGQIMARSYPDWEMIGVRRVEGYGKQKCWKRKSDNDEEEDLIL